MIYLYKTNGVITVGEDEKVPITYYGRGGKSGKFYPVKNQIGNDEVIIGNQIWTSKNLDVTIYNNGDIIPQVQDQNDWDNLTTGAWCYYNNDENNNSIYGRLYNWYAITDPRGIAPIGFNMPTQSDYQILSDYLGGDAVAGGKMKEIGLLHWKSPNTNATNSSGFTALPAGYREDDFYSITEISRYWTTTEFNSTDAINCSLLYNNEALGVGAIDIKQLGASVRCFKDAYNGFLINIGGDNYQVIWENLVIDGTSPTSFSQANDLLLNLFS